MKKYHRRRSASTPSNLMLVPYSEGHAKPEIGIPSGWIAKEVPRPDGSRSDMFYYEPGTGRKFRSTREIERYLKEKEPSSRRMMTLRTRKTLNSGFGNTSLAIQKAADIRRSIVSGGKLLKLQEEKRGSHLDTSGKIAQQASSILTDGWIVEEVPRRHNPSWIDTFYREPGTGRQFRSLVSAVRYLEELEENRPLSKTLEEIKKNLPSKALKRKGHAENSPQQKESISPEYAQSPLPVPPMEVNWVLTSIENNVWSPSISESKVHDTVKQQWAERFMLIMNGGKQSA